MMDSRTDSNTETYQCDICESTFDRSGATCPKCGIGQLEVVTDE